MAEPQWTLTLKIENDRKHPLLLFVEPWAEDYTLLPGEAVDVRADISAEAFNGGHYLHFCYEERRIILWAEHGCLIITVNKDGEELECGYHRKEWKQFCKAAGINNGIE